MVKIATKLTIEMQLKKDGVRANVTLDGEKKTYFFHFGSTRNEALRVEQLICHLPRNFYIDAFLEHIKK